MHIRTVDDQSSTLKEINMYRTVVTAARAMTICIAATLGFNAADATAGSAANDQSVTDGSFAYVVRFPDLDLSRIEGTTTLYARLIEAARVVCEPLDSRELGLFAKYQACMNKAVAGAVAGVNHPLLSQYHQLRTKGDAAGLVQLARVN